MSPRTNSLNLQQFTVLSRNRPVQMRKHLALPHLGPAAKTSGLDGFQRVPRGDSLHEILDEALSVVVRQRASGLKPLVFPDVPLQGRQRISQGARQLDMTAKVFRPELW